MQGNPRGHRERNESAEDLEREEAARQRIQSAWRCIIQPLRSEAYRVDWAIFKTANQFVGWGEYKFRGRDRAGNEVRMSAYPSVMLSLSKWVTLKTLAQQTSRSFYLFVEWADCLCYRQWPAHTGMGYPINYEICIGGREDRNQDGDKEPVILIPNKEFKFIGPQHGDS